MAIIAELIDEAIMQGPDQHALQVVRAKVAQLLTRFPLYPDIEEEN
jgi:hypothetical protein